MGLSVSRGASIKPPGNMVTVHVLNRGADDVLRLVAHVTSEYSIVTAETSSLIDRSSVSWSSVTSMRRSGRNWKPGCVTQADHLGFSGFNGPGRCPRLLGLTTKGASQATALIAALIIALGVTLHRWNVVQRGLLSTLN